MSEAVDFQPNPAELSVAIGIPAAPAIPWATALSLARTTHACALRGINMGIEPVVGSSIITVARSLVMQRFLKTDKKRLFWLDSDLEWEPEDFLRLLGLSQKFDVVCGAYPLKRDEENGGHSFVVLREDENQPDKLTVNEYGCIKIGGTGLGFCAMTRAAVEKLAATKLTVFNQGTNEQMLDAFRIDAPGGIVRGEDMAFFSDLRTLGYDIWLDPTISLGHIGYKVYRGDLVKAYGLEHIFERVQ